MSTIENQWLTDDELVDGFVAATIPPTTFDHAQHVRLAWLYLQRWPLLESLARMATDTRRFATTHGDPGKYHETVTWAWMMLIHERMARDRRQGDGLAADWPAFARRHPDLLASAPNLLERYYARETLATDLARATFVLPDLSATARTPANP